MAGSLPPRYLLVTQGNKVVSECSNYSEVLELFNPSIDDNGHITVLGIKSTMNYALNGHNCWDKYSALSDFAKCYMKQTIARKGIRIHECIKK